MFGFSGNRRWVYPQHVDGRFRRLRRRLGSALLGFLVLAPWVPVGGHPAFRFDVEARRAYVLGEVFTASDGFLMVLVALLAVFALFLFTSLYGRLWCGYTCPQTVFLEELVRPLERWIEGDRGARMRRDRGPWTWDRAWRRTAKLTAFLAVAGFVSMSFTSWFAGATELWTGRAGPVAYTVVAALTAVAFADFAWFREQLCNYVCPYARFQGALADDESLVVAYDRARGEPRGDKAAARARGACIDCGRCVAVCPQGIDIRDGYQLECVTCARCVDACTGVMGKLGHPSLIRYATQSEGEGRAPRVVRPRTVVYGALVTACAAGLIAGAASRTPIDASVQRQPGSLYSVDADGWIRNTYVVRLASREDAADHVEITVEGLDDADVIAPTVDLGPDEARTVPLVVRVPPEAAHERTLPIRVRVRSRHGEVVRPTTFKTPGAS